MLCSDIRSYKVADAVAASAAVPLAFAPIVLETYPGGCSTRLPDWIERARHNPDAQPLLRSFAEATARYHDGSMKYVKLVDNFGLSGFSIGILAAQRDHGPTVSMGRAGRSWWRPPPTPPSMRAFV